MRLLEFNVDLQSNRELTINGRRLEYLKDKDIPFDEKAIEKTAHPEQVFYLLCELNKLTAKMQRTYEKCRIRNGEIGDKKIIVGGS